VEAHRLDVRVGEVTLGTQQAGRLVEQAARVAVAACEKKQVAHHMVAGAPVHAICQRVDRTTLAGNLKVEYVAGLDVYAADDRTHGLQVGIAGQGLGLSRRCVLRCLQRYCGRRPRNASSQQQRKHRQ
jgi:hypothetical protein